MTQSTVDAPEPIADAIAQVTKRSAKERDAFKEKLARARDNVAEALAIWGDIAASGRDDEGPFKAVISVGPERARALHALHLEQRALCAELTALSGYALADSMGILADDLDVVRAYDQLEADETYAARASAAQTLLSGRIERLNEALSGL